MAQIIVGALLALAIGGIANAAPPTAILPGGGSAAIAPGAGGPVGTVLSSSGLPAGSTYQWLRAGSAISGATSAGYTTVTADGGQTVSLQVKLPGVSITAGGGGSTGDLDFTQASNSASVAILAF